ncbi:MAG: choice-of-anchor Q domain-containing protein, partial [Chloroflexota bacterium]
AGNDAVCQAAPVNNRDQRGLPRPQGTHCDIGSFERGPVLQVTANGDACGLEGSCVDLTQNPVTQDGWTYADAEGYAFTTASVSALRKLVLQCTRVSTDSDTPVETTGLVDTVRSSRSYANGLIEESRSTGVLGGSATSTVSWNGLTLNARGTVSGAEGVDNTANNGLGRQTSGGFRITIQGTLATRTYGDGSWGPWTALPSGSISCVAAPGSQTLADSGLSQNQGLDGGLAQNISAN